MSSRILQIIFSLWEETEVKSHVITVQSSHVPQPTFSLYNTSLSLLSYSLQTRTSSQRLIISNSVTVSSVTTGAFKQSITAFNRLTRKIICGLSVVHHRTGSQTFRAGFRPVLPIWLFAYSGQCWWFTRWLLAEREHTLNFPSVYASGIASVCWQTRTLFAPGQAAFLIYPAGSGSVCPSDTACRPKPDPQSTWSPTAQDSSCPSLPWTVSAPKSSKKWESTSPFNSHLTVQCSGRSPGGPLVQLCDEILELPVVVCADEVNDFHLLTLTKFSDLNMSCPFSERAWHKLWTHQ